MVETTTEGLEVGHYLYKSIITWLEVFNGLIQVNFFMKCDLKLMERVRKVTSVGAVLKEIRGAKTQQQLAFEMGVVRETVSKYETGRSQLPQDISRTLVDKFDNPKFAITVRNEYTGTGPRWLDGPNVDLHRSSVKEKTIEELQEALEAIAKLRLANPLKLFDFQHVEEMLLEAAEAITALDHFIAVICTETKISYTGLWDKHYKELTSAGYTTI